MKHLSSELHRISAPLLALALLSCGGIAAGGAPAEQAVPAAGRAVRSRDGQSIAYEIVGAGATTVVVAHGWGMSGALLHPAVDALADRYRFVLVDLPGHGCSGRTRTAWTVERYADDLAAVVTALHVDAPILVGHSMSGRVVVEAATGVLRESARGVVLVDALLDVDQPPGEEARRSMVPDLQRDFAGAVRRIVRSMSPPDLPAGALGAVEASITAMDPAIAVAILDDNLRYPILEKLRQLRQPLWSVNAGWAPTAEAHNRRLVPGWRTVVVPHSSHWLMVDHPADFAAALRTALDALSGASAAPAR